MKTKTTDKEEKIDKSRSNIVVVIIGNRGTGKSVFATMMALDSDIPVYANFIIESKKYRNLSFKDLMNLKGHSLVILDEAHGIVDARRSSSNINLYMSHLLSQSRKYKFDLIIISQLESMLDLRYMGMANFYVQSKLTLNGFQYEIYNENLELIDILLLLFEIAEKYIYDKYDTYQPIQESIDLGNQLSIINPIDKEKAIDEIINEMEKESPLENWTKSMIKDLLYEKRYPVNDYLDSIYGRIKRILNKQNESKIEETKKKKVIKKKKVVENE